MKWNEDSEDSYKKERSTKIMADESMNYGAGCFYPMFFMLFILLAWGGNGFGGNRAYGYDSNLARIQDVYASNDLQSIRSGINNLGNGIADATFALNNNILNQSNLLQRDMFGGIQTITDKMGANTGAIVNAVTGVGREVLENKFTSQLETCGINRNIDALRFGSAKETADIINAINASSQKVIDHMTNTETQALRDKLAEKDREVLQANILIGQGVQADRALAAQGRFVPYAGCGYPQGCGGCGCNCNGN